MKLCLDQPAVAAPKPTAQRAWDLAPSARRDDTGLIGVLGGMGPLATVDFMRKVIDATPAARDQDHVPLIVSSIPQIPDRTEGFRGSGASPLSAMVSSGRRLIDAGAGMIVIPCNTAHLWFDELQAALKVPMVHIADASLDEAGLIVGASNGPIGLLATEATVASGLYVTRASRRGMAQPSAWVLPTATEMANLVSPGIAAVKAGQLAKANDLLMKALIALQERGAETVILGCTEIPVVLDAAQTPVPVCDSTAALARRAVAWSLAQRRAEAGSPS